MLFYLENKMTVSLSASTTKIQLLQTSHNLSSHKQTVYLLFHKKTCIAILLDLFTLQLTRFPSFVPTIYPARRIMSSPTRKVRKKEKGNVVGGGAILPHTLPNTSWL